MGIFDKLAGWLAPGGTKGEAAPAPSGSVGIRSPWSGTSLQRVVLADLFGLDTNPVTRAEAMAVPSIKRARLLLTTDASRSPLEALDAADARVDLPWLYRTNVAVSPQHRMVWTVDDLIFHGWSLWLCQRDDAGDITDAARCPWEWWSFGEGGSILVNDEAVPEGQAILIPGYHAGIVADNPETIRGARQLETIWQARARNPVPALELHQTTSDTMTGEEVDDLVDSWIASMQRTDGAVGWTPLSIEARVHGEGSADLLIQGRNAAAVDGARIVGVPASMVDASNVNASLEYETVKGRSSEYLDHSLPVYLGAVEARLSLDDVCPPGVRIRANTTALNNGPSITGTPTGD